LQHAHNPVDWYPWNSEALDKARVEDKPIFLSIGYSACHWCHVMAHESFEDPEVAAFLNAHFVSIKVDREERPDVDEIYMAAAQIQTGAGGWPLTVFLLPNLTPFFAGTYFPREDRFGRPGFMSVLRAVKKAWDEDRDRIERSGSQMAEHIRKSVTQSPSPADTTLDRNIVARAVDDLRHTFDHTHGGFGGAPKFPQTAALDLVLRQHYRTGDPQLLDLVSLTLEKMAYGGICDQLGGGFHRYSTDDQWLVPHFEKMLYDNALLARLYMNTYRLTRNGLFRDIAENTLNYVLRDMRDPTGAFHAAQDADSEGQEGRYYVWTRGAIIEALGKEDGEIFCACYAVHEQGNFHSPETCHAGQNILHVAEPFAVVAKRLGLLPHALEEKLVPMRQALLTRRAERVAPGKDDKILVAWNGMMISALADGYRLTDNAAYREAAETAARFILDTMLRDGVLCHSWRDGRAQIPAYLDDYAWFISSLLDLYEATFESSWLDPAQQLTETMIEAFWNETCAAFHSTSEKHDHLIARSVTTYDGAVPSGNAVAAALLLRQAILFNRQDYRAVAERIVKGSSTNIARSPRGFLGLLGVLESCLGASRQIVVAGSPENPDFTALAKVLGRQYLADAVVAGYDPVADRALRDRLPLLEGKDLVGGNPAAYVCENYECRQPVTTPGELVALLKPSYKE